VPSFLIVDDEQAVAGTLGRMLTLAGHEVTCAFSAEAGLEKALETPPDALLVDLRMPVVSGLEFLRRMRNNPQLRELPVALVTGDYFLEDAVLSEIQALGATVRYKPLWLEDVIALANTLTQPQA
jgi:CheY-like chemotaxis protein